MDFIGEKIANRMGGKDFDPSKKSYKFMSIKKAKTDLKEKYPNADIIDLGVGEPDIQADSQVVNTLSLEAGKKENRWYADNGIQEFKDAAVKYLENVYGISNLDPKTEVMHGIGSKSILSMIPLCFINPGDITLTTVPGYPVIANHTRYLGGYVYNLPLYKENNYYPDFTSIPQDILKKAKLLYINYPNNPTGQIASEQFYKEVIEFAYKNDILVVSDASYSALVFDNNKPFSFFCIDGAKEVGVEIYSLSKAFNMTGWRLAFIVGNKRFIDVYADMKSTIDSGQFIAIQKAGICALNNPDITKENCKRYSRRHDLLVEALKEVGFKVEKPKATFYCYAPIPIGTKSGVVFKNAQDASNYILNNAFISTVPWDDAGSFLRFSVTFEADSYEDEKRIINEVKNRLLKLELVF
ncbi:LL-diaminopimelate aminotransferase apoenzyme [Alkalithermobacter thermoalcaliphilus JW-YL-7 = DSM 7308]|uniref:Aminotransferase n=1 Tax=Alkalithermobacter thermoalcaliphilus JW-YL-7 = DSM 7308 TaxID=1121328 RepID=A0A150FQP5_CLOPD|nr:LL-diaminopimelate aminotransferase [[Clostridium] paradoxum JW-YL-7 = DSM 7308]SHK54269.1 LL-diaminopimelate aminotransferase apoenzyme [[Clostridium] paradoxum JW-YL-7 = DSM 7308]